jgi:hypothetical protein
MNTPDNVFALVFAGIVILAATPQAKEFLRKVQKARVECKLKMRMIKGGSSADEIVQSILSHCERESTSQRV